MIRRPNILLLGAAGRNAGKTEFACRLIRRLSPQLPVAAAKITVIRESPGGCPRGGKGCGVCGSLTDTYSLSEEDRCGDDKDTMRMKAAGAGPVFWLRVKQPYLDEGMAQLLSRLPADGPVICESNSARQALEPGFFLVIGACEGEAPSEPLAGPKDGSGGASPSPGGASPSRLRPNAAALNMKPSCQSVLCHADALARFDGAGWDVDPARLRYAGGRWAMPEDAGAIVLAGGRSRRMGRDKSLLDIGGRPMVQHIVDQLRPLFDCILIGANDAAKYRFLNLPVVADREPDLGPLMGILSGLAASPYERNFVIGCDIPTIQRPFVREMIAMADEADIVMPVTADGRHEPLYAVYRRSVIPVAEQILAGGGRRVVELCDRVKTRLVPLPPGEWYWNVNTPEDYAKLVSC